MNIINLTAHTINVILEGKEIAYPSRGLARVKTEEKEVGKINGIPVVKTAYTTVEGLPEPEEDTVYSICLDTYMQKKRQKKKQKMRRKMKQKMKKKQRDLYMISFLNGRRR